MASLTVKFVSKKISKVRWRPKSSSVFVTGSWDDDENVVCVWKCPSPHINSEVEGLDIGEPRLLNTLKFAGSVTDLKVVSDDLIFASSSLGSLCMLKYSEDKLLHAHAWENLHHFSKGTASATGLSVKGNDIASVGEDGRLCIINFKTQQKVKEIESSDLCSFTTVCYLRHHEIVLGNSVGYLRLLDLRSPSTTPSCLLLVSREQSGVWSMGVHPSQTHVVATGHEDGSLCVWDMRQDRQPVALLQAHSAAVSELLFHPTHPDFLYTCSLDGCVLQWDSSNLRSSTFMDTEQGGARGDPWLNCDAKKHKLNIMSLFVQRSCSVNTLDLSGSTLLWGTDKEALYILNNIKV